MIGLAEDIKDPLRSKGKYTCCYVEQSLQEGVAQVPGRRCEVVDVVPEKKKSQIEMVRWRKMPVCRSSLYLQAAHEWN